MFRLSGISKSGKKIPNELLTTEHRALGKQRFDDKKNYGTDPDWQLVLSGKSQGKKVQQELAQAAKSQGFLRNTGAKILNWIKLRLDKIRSK